MSSVAHKVLFLPELLSSIFEQLHALSSAPHHSIPYPIHPDALPFQLARVSKLWAAVAEDTPRLYSTFSLRLSGSKYELPMLKYYLKHSGGLDLHTYLEYSPTQDEEESKSLHVQPFVDLLVSNASRWRNVTFKLPGDDIFNLTYKALPALSCPHMKSLSLIETSATTTPMPSSSSTAEPVGSFPALTSLTLSRLSPAPLLHLLLAFLDLLPTYQITNLTLIPHYARASSQLSALDALRILSLFPRIRRLSIGVADITGHSLNTIEPLSSDQKDLTLSTLSHLTLAGHPSAIAGLFEGLTLPSLAWVQSRYPANETEDEAFIRCLERSGRAVKEPEYDAFEDDYYSWTSNGAGGWARGRGEDGAVEIVSAEGY